MRYVGKGSGIFSWDDGPLLPSPDDARAQIKVWVSPAGRRTPAWAMSMKEKRFPPAWVRTQVPGADMFGPLSLAQRNVTVLSVPYVAGVLKSAWTGEPDSGMSCVSTVVRSASVPL